MEHFDCSFVGPSCGHAGYILADDARRAAAAFRVKLVTYDVREAGVIYVRDGRGSVILEQAYAPVGLRDVVATRRGRATPA